MLKLKLKCPYNCEWKGSFAQLDNHFKECNSKMYQCKYNKLGCNFVDKKDKCKEHEKSNDEEHFKIALEYFDKNAYLNKKIRFDLNQVCKVSCHPHPLTFVGSGAWGCDGRKLEGGCLSPNPHFKVIYRFRCIDCDFDLCPYCILKYSIVDNN